MKAFLKVFAWLALAMVVGCFALTAAGACPNPCGFNLALDGSPMAAVPACIVGAAGLLVAILATIAAFGIAFISIVGAGLLVCLSLAACGLLLLCIAVPFLLPIAVPLAIVIGIVALIRSSGRRRTA